MEVYREQVFDEERALYGQAGVKLLACVVDSIKNPKSGTIKVPGVKEIIMDDPAAQGRIILPRTSRCA